MPVDYDDYDWIKRSVGEVSADRGLSQDRAFAVWCLEFIHAIERDDAIDFTDTLAQGDCGIDGYYWDDGEKIFSLWQCKWTDDLNHSFDSSPASEVKSGFARLLTENPSPPLSQKLAHISQRLRSEISHGKSIRLIVGIATEMTNDAEMRVAEIEAEANDTLKEYLHRTSDSSVEADEDISVSSVSFEIFDSKKLRQERDARDPSNETLEGVDVMFDLNSPSLIEIGNDDPIVPNGWKALVVTLSGKKLGEVASFYKDRLFSLNVRFALGTTTRIRALRDSVADEEKSKYFWLYNNGLTILCDKFVIVNGADNKAKSIKVTNPQVVNGCQTVTAFRIKGGECRGNVAPSVLARIIVAPSGEASIGQANLLAKYTNSQSPIQSRDLASNDPVQLRIHSKFDHLPTPWFYERKRGEWGTLTTARRTRYKVENGESIIWTDRYRRVTNEVVGQLFWALSDPSVAIKKKGNLWEDDDTYRSIFNEASSAEVLLFPVLLKTFFDEFWKNRVSSKHSIQTVSSEEFDDDRLARVLRAKGQIVFHSVAITAKAFTLDDKLSVKDAKVGMSVIPRLWERADEFLYPMAAAFDTVIEFAEEDDDIGSIKLYFEKPNKHAFDKLWKELRKTMRMKHSAEWQIDFRNKLLE